MRILFISESSPWPVLGGGSQRSYLVLRALQELGEVDLAVASRGGLNAIEGLHDRFQVVAMSTWRAPGERWPFRWLYGRNPLLANQAALALLPKQVEYRPDPNTAPTVRRLLKEGNYDLVVSRYLRATMKSGCTEGWSGPTILDLDDVDSHVYLSRLNDPHLPRWKRWINHRHYRSAEALQRRWLPRFDAVWLTTPHPEGFDYLRHVAWLPNIPYLAEGAPVAGRLPEPPPDAPPAILFVGSLSLYPNVSALDHFLRAVWPAVHSAEPRARFRIAGLGLQPECRDRWGAVPGVELLGFVEDMATAYAGCHFSVAPILSGSGTNIKVLECFAYGRTCVASAFAAARFTNVLRDGESLRVGGTDEAFATACVELLRDGDQRATLAANGREVVQRHFSFDAFKKSIADSVTEVTTRRRNGDHQRASVLPSALASVH